MKRAWFSLTTLLTFHPCFRSGLWAQWRQRIHTLQGPLNSQQRSTAKLRAQGKAGHEGTGRRRAGPARRPLPAGALTKHRGPSWSPGRRSRASAAFSPVSQTGQGLRPPDLASLKPRAAVSTANLHSPRLR